MDFEDNYGEKIDVKNNDGDENDDVFVDDEDKEIVEPLWFTPEQQRDNQPHPVQLRRSNSGPFQSFASFPQFVIRFLFA